MYDTYEDYLKLPLTIPFEEAAELHKEILSQIENDEDGKELYQEVLETATRYLEIYGKSRVWRDRLGDNTVDPYYRKTIGDFGCYLVFINSIMAR